MKQGRRRSLRAENKVQSKGLRAKKGERRGRGSDLALCFAYLPRQPRDSEGEERAPRYLRLSGATDTYLRLLLTFHEMGLDCFNHQSRRTRQYPLNPQRLLKLSATMKR